MSPDDVHPWPSAAHTLMNDSAGNLANRIIPRLLPSPITEMYRRTANRFTRGIAASSLWLTVFGTIQVRWTPRQQCVDETVSIAMLPAAVKVTPRLLTYSRTESSRRVVNAIQAVVRLHLGATPQVADQRSGLGLCTSDASADGQFGSTVSGLVPILILTSFRRSANMQDCPTSVAPQGRVRLLLHHRARL